MPTNWNHYIRIVFLIALMHFAITSSMALSTEPAVEKQSDWAAPFPDYIFDISEVMLHDVINPPAAARYYAYTSLAAYAAYLNGNPEQSLLDRFQSPLKIDYSAFNDKVDLTFSAIYALLEVGKKLLPSGYLLQSNQDKLIKKFRKKGRHTKKEVVASVAYAQQIANQVIEYSKQDGYRKLSTLTRYTPSGEEGKWYPTPPAYIEAVEPHWNTIRTFYLDSASQFPPPPPVEFSKVSGSGFHKQMMAVYHAVKDRTKQQYEIAKFWDCNPFEVEFTGHMAIGLKKITPGGHWMGITGIATENSGCSLDSTLFAFALVGTSMHDAFISCWDEKYRSDRIRPETIINRLVDPSWRPVLQTPPFPEYTSGHSVVSATSATVLTQLFGEAFSFNDTTEIIFGLPARKFNSFREASEEAAISRLYGGIHYPDACEDGVVQGNQVGEFILKKIGNIKNSGIDNKQSLNQK